MTIRAKFRVAQVLNNIGIGGQVTAQIVKLYPVTGGPDENLAFWSATPSGCLEETITNPAAFGFYVVDKTYYIDSTPADE